MTIEQTLQKAGVIPVMNIGDTALAIRVAEILLEEHMGVMELTFRNPAAGEVIAAVREKFPEMTLGAGTLRTVNQLDSALQSNCDFLVSPSLVPSVARAWKAAVDNGRTDVPYIPGVTSPREVEEVLEYGITTQKFFPATAAGGTAMLKALKPTHPEVRFIPTGGINRENLESFISLPNVLACGAGAVVPSALLVDLGNGDAHAVEGIRREIRVMREICRPYCE